MPVRGCGLVSDITGLAVHHVINSMRIRAPCESFHFVFASFDFLVPIKKDSTTTPGCELDPQHTKKKKKAHFQTDFGLFAEAPRIRMTAVS